MNKLLFSNDSFGSDPLHFLLMANPVCLLLSETNPTVFMSLSCKETANLLFLITELKGNASNTQPLCYSDI